MESEKVKEIKKVLKYLIDKGLVMGENTMVANIKLADILTLINELESENEKLRNAKVIYETVDYCAEDLKKAEKRIAELETSEFNSCQELDNASAQIHSLENRIAELEKEKESLKKQLIAIDTLDETNFEKRHNAIVFITEKQLKQFAERLKEKVYDSFGDKVIWYNDIDETLKEFKDGK